MTRALLIAVVALSCSRQRTEAPAPAPQPAAAATPPVPAKSPAPPKPAPTWADISSNDCSYGCNLQGQLDRIDAVLTSKAVLTETDGLKSLFSESEAQLPRLRELAADRGRAADPRLYMVIASTATQRARGDGTVLYQMLTKNAEHDAGRPWFIMGAKILELHEDDQVTGGKLEMDPGKNPLFIVGRFKTPFVEDDRVDVIGYFAGNYTFKTTTGLKETLPAFAVAGMFKEGTIRAMNKIVHTWPKDIPPDALRSMPRKY